MIASNWMVATNSDRVVKQPLRHEWQLMRNAIRSLSSQSTRSLILLSLTLDMINHGSCEHGYIHGKLVRKDLG